MPSSQGGVMLLPFTRRLLTTSILACCFPPSAGELANCSLPAHSSNDWRVSQMRPAVEGQGGRDLQVWAFSAIPKGNLNSPHSVQLGKHSHSCLGEAASASQARCTVQAHPSHSWPSRRNLSAGSLPANITSQSVAAFIHTCTHEHKHTHSA